MDSKALTTIERVTLLVESLDGGEETNEALSRCKDGHEMVEILLNAYSRMEHGFTRNDLLKTAPTRDWIWWKNKQALVTLGDGNLRHQQDSSDKTRWDSWTLDFFKLLKIRL